MIFSAKYVEYDVTDIIFNNAERNFLNERIE